MSSLLEAMHTGGEVMLGAGVRRHGPNMLCDWCSFHLYVQILGSKMIRPTQVISNVL